MSRNGHIGLVDRALRFAVKDVLFPLQESLKHHDTFAMLREMERDQSAAPDRLRALQDARLTELVRHAASTTPYYSELFRDAGVDAAAFRGVEDLPRLPFLTKDLVRKGPERLVTNLPHRAMRYSTGGSTGAPMIFFYGNRRASSDVAARWRAEAWWGVGIGDPELVIWGAPVELKKQDRVRGLRDRIMRTRLLSAFEMTPEVMDRYIEILLQERPRRVFGYASSISLLCERAAKTGRDLRQAGVRAVFVTGEYLWEHWRKAIEDALGCRAANGYGGRDSGFIAHECPAGGMHITADRMIVETVGADGKSVNAGELGEIVVTHFDTFEMPFLRYRTGDMGVLSTRSCTCGITLPILDRVEGRNTDFVVTPDGRLMHGLSVIYILRDVPGVAEFRIVQKEPARFEVTIVRGPGYSTEAEAGIRRGFNDRFRANVNVKIDYVDAIPNLASGKYRYVISEVAGAARTSQ